MSFERRFAYTGLKRFRLSRPRLFAIIVSVSEIFLPFRKSPIEPVTHARSTFIVAAMQMLRTHDLFARYGEALAPGFREQILSLVAGMWIPVELAIEHYRAADRLDIHPLTIDAIGNEVAQRTFKNAVSSAFKRLNRSDVTPWDIFAFSHENNDQHWRGGDRQIIREGPRQALYEWAGQPCASVPYFNKSVAAFVRALINHTCLRAHQRIVQERCSETTLSVRFSWV
jgi:hypothetical protein